MHFGSSTPVIRERILANIMARRLRRPLFSTRERRAKTFAPVGHGSTGLWDTGVVDALARSLEMMGYTKDSKEVAPPGGY